jgi:dihydropyrimidine dehydrogenase (NAD+) subunit PreT
MSSVFLPLLARDRDELTLADKKPTYTEAEARAEAERCIYCVDAPCIKACPTEIDIPTFIKKIATGNVRGSAATIFDQNILGYSCARVCPVEVLCVGSCVYTGWHRDPIQIGKLQRFATESAVATAKSPLFSAKPPSGKKVALVGGGPASLACAAYLSLAGHKAVILEKRALPGGLNTTGIAPYKLHAEDALHEVAWVESFGVEIRTGVEVGKELTGKQLLAEYDAVYIGVGLGEDSKLGIPGEEGPGVFGATRWIEEMKLAPSPKKKLGRVLVIGGGNTAIDVARECALLGAEDVAMVYRRGPEAMSGYPHEMSGARHETVRLIAHATPKEFLRDGKGGLVGLRVTTGGIEIDLPCDLVALAIGQSKVRGIASEFPGVEVDASGCIKADPTNGMTGNPKVFSGGDCINGGKEVVNAVADGRNTARYLDAIWSKKN